MSANDNIVEFNTSRIKRPIVEHGIYDAAHQAIAGFEETYRQAYLFALLSHYGKDRLFENIIR